MDLEGGAPPGARASTAASKSSGAIARRGQPWGGASLAWPQTGGEASEGGGLFHRCAPCSLVRPRRGREMSGEMVPTMHEGEVRDTEG
jgi:hypothetical protein